jgi:hypothetical protein
VEKEKEEAETPDVGGRQGLDYTKTAAASKIKHIKTNQHYYKVLQK